MASFLVLAPRLQNGQRDEDKTVFIRDGFSVLAFVLPVPWLLVHRLWFEAALVLAGMIAISIVGGSTGHENMAALITGLLSLFVGFEANSWRAAALERRDFEQITIVDAHNAADAETAWLFGGASPSAPTPASPVPPTPPELSAGYRQPLGGMVGLVSLRGEN